jgi:tetratricopeptide (TPR) repeat protein
MRSLAGTSLVVAMLALGFVGCGKVGELKAMKAFKAANAAYQQQDYKKAVPLYEEAISSAPETQAAHQAYFFLGNSYDQQFKPSKKGEADNDALLTKAVDNYAKAAETLSASNDPGDKKLGKLSLEYLVAAYGADKLNDPSKAEPVLQKMIQAEPGEPTTYFQLAKLMKTPASTTPPKKCISPERMPSRRRPTATCRSPATTTARDNSTRPSKRSNSVRRASRTIQKRSTRFPRSTGTRRSAMRV